MTNIELKKWVVEQAVKFNEDQEIVPVVNLARQFYDFVKEDKVDSESKFNNTFNFGYWPSDEWQPNPGYMPVNPSTMVEGICEGGAVLSDYADDFVWEDDVDVDTILKYRVVE